MIQPPGWDGVAFSDDSDGDLRDDERARHAAARALGIEGRWATVRQVHGNEVRRVSQAGDAGEADALWTTTTRLPLAVFTADCYGVVLGAPGSVGVAHAGWRGAAGGVVTNVITAMTAAGHPPQRAAIGPGIGPCCFEVGAEVAERFPTWATTTSWGSTSVDLAAAVRAQLDGLEIWASDGCTVHDDGWFSHRDSGTSERMAAIGWLA